MKEALEIVGGRINELELILIGERPNIYNLDRVQMGGRIAELRRLYHQLLTSLSAS